MSGILEIRDERLLSVADQNAELEKAAEGFVFIEGPIWHPHEKHLIFSDIRGDAMYRWSASEGLNEFRRPSNMANGNTYDRQGRILTCEHATSRVTRTDLIGKVEVLASHYKGKELNSPNDIVVKSDDFIYFTDPLSGRTEKYGVLREQELDFQGVFKLNPENGSLTLLVDDFEKPNGLCFSPDEKRLFINDTARRHIRVFDVLEDGTIANGRLFAETTGDAVGVADGMKFDQNGFLFCCGPGGVQVFDGQGVCLGVIRFPEQAANFTWGDDDLKSLYVTASTTLYRVRVKTPGFPIF